MHVFWQVSVLPQPSGGVPHAAETKEQVIGVQPQTLACGPPPHVSGAVQLPQVIVPPHPSSQGPQLNGFGQAVSGTHVQTLLTQLGRLGGHVPQSTKPPQPSEMLPQFCPAAHWVMGVQLLHWLLLQF